MKGHLRERSPGRWAIVIDAHDVQTGKRRRRWHSFAGNKRQAQIECARLISELQSGAAIDPNKITVAQFLDRFERDWVVAHVGARSADRYRGALGHVRRHLGERLLQKLSPAELAAFYAVLFRSGLQPRTVKLVHRMLHRALKSSGGLSVTTRPRWPSHHRRRIRKPRCCSRRRRPCCSISFAAGRYIG
jgi:hypothetical protein